MCFVKANRSRHNIVGEGCESDRCVRFENRDGESPVSRRLTEESTSSHESATSSLVIEVTFVCSGRNRFVRRGKVSVPWPMRPDRSKGVTLSDP